MKLWKRILLTLLLLGITAYLALAVGLLCRAPEGTVCRDVQLLLKDTVRAGLLNKKELLELMKQRGLDPCGRPMEEIETAAIEKALSGHPLIDEVQCYKTPGGLLCIEAWQRIPVLHVLTDRGENYFVDTKGRILSSKARCAARLPVATGTVSEAQATGSLYRFACWLQTDPFWDAQTEQIHVLPGGEVELVPRVGQHLIFLGRLTDYERKLARVKAFYLKGLNRVGWNRYRRINVEFGNQIICTKEE